MVKSKGFVFFFIINQNNKIMVWNSGVGGRGDAILPARVLDRRLQVDWARDAREGPRVLMSLRVDFGPMG